MIGAKLEKVLVANRGEIAVRVITACKELGIKTVAVFSDVDARAPHTLLADEARSLGAPEPASSYLNIDKLIDLARASGARAVHPGYGFLSENAAFSAACADAGLIFIGPGPETIEALGDKARARELALRAGAPVIPGVALGEGGLEQARGQAEAIGYPVLLKAVAGGGGKGMRVVQEPAELASALEAARQEGKTAFGDERLLVEKYIERPRHVEVQILVDGQQNALHLGERECSIQRRHQKIIEESPSPLVDPAMREEMGRVALRIAAEADYLNAGTVEFITSGSGEFFFLEVNTRLQVEHPITECVSGVDLVHEQLNIAAGGAISLAQEAIRLRGHAIECRVYAEDPARGFSPSPGTILALSEPRIAGVRVDSGVRCGQVVPYHYDPLLAKVIAWAPDRPRCVARMRQAVEQYTLLGFPTNLRFLADALAQPAFLRGELSTDFIDDHLANWHPPAASEREAAIAAAILAIGSGAGRPAASGGSGARVAASPWETLSGWRVS